MTAHNSPGDRVSILPEPGSSALRRVTASVRERFHDVSARLHAAGAPLFYAGMGMLVASGFINLATGSVPVPALGDAGVAIGFTGLALRHTPTINNRLRRVALGASAAVVVAGAALHAAGVPAGGAVTLAGELGCVAVACGPRVHEAFRRHRTGPKRFHRTPGHPNGGSGLNR